VSADAPAPIPLDRAAYNVSIAAFEGPLDLLLHLIQKHELDIFDIPISFVTEKYLEYLRLMDALNLDIASEYLLMAATLAHIKSRELLPSVPEAQSAQDDAVGELEEDPRVALIRRLLEYQKFKLAGEELAARGIAGRDVFTRGVDLRADLEQTAPLASIPMHSLLEAFQRVLSRKDTRVHHEVTEERVSIADRIHQIVDRLRARGVRNCTFEELFDDARTTHELVVTFLALLEMTRLKMTRVYQAAALSPIHVTLVLEDVDPASITADVD
jgi:segregation and condensation protein A